MSRTTATAWKLLLAGTTHSDAIVRCDAARLLGELGDRRAVPALTRQLTVDRHLTKITAVYALGDLGSRTAAPILRRIAADPGVFRFPGMHYHDMIRLAAALQLARWGDDSGVRAVGDLLRLRLLPAMLELGPAILAAPRSAAVKRLRDYLTLPFLMSFREGRPSASNHFFVDRNLAYFREPAARKVLLADLAHFSRYVRVGAATALLAQDTANLPAVTRQAKRERSAFGRVRFAALLHTHGGPDATPAVVRGLRDRDAFVRATALDVAAELKLKSLAPAVERALADADDHVRIRAAAALPVVAPARARTLLPPLLSAASPRVAVQAACSLLAIA